MGQADPIEPGMESRPKPFSNRDFDFFYQGLDEGKLLVQQCSACGTLRNPPGPSCPACRSLEWRPLALEGSGTIYSYSTHYHPPLPGFAVPHPIIVAEMAEGIRLMAAADGTSPEALRIGARVRVEFVHRGNYAGFRFRLDG
jgi:uncharacterized OB-fold protein